MQALALEDTGLDALLLPTNTIELPQSAEMRPALPTDADAIAALHARVFGPGRFARTAYRVREGTEPITPLCRLISMDGRLVAAIRMTLISIGGRTGAALLGPLAVEDAHRRRNLGKILVTEALAASKALGLELVILVGDTDYYGAFGFAPVPPGCIQLPGPVDPRRLLAVELTHAALERFSGSVTAERHA